MPHRKIVQDYCIDLVSLTDTLTKLVNSYRLLVGGAAELNQIALTHKSDVKDAVDRANELGKIIDKLIDTLDEAQGSYNKYCLLKNDVLKSKMHSQYILTEIDEELKLKE